MKKLLLIGCLACAACQNEPDWMPLESGRSWTYRVRTPLYNYLESVRITGRVPVGNKLGYKLAGEMGPCRLVWKDNLLIASMFGPTHFTPPIPLFDASSETATHKWSGRVLIAGKTHDGKATLSQLDEEVRVAGRKLKSRKATLILEFGGTTLEWTSWFVKGIGAVRQQQRTNGVLDVSLEWIRGS